MNSDMLDYTIKRLILGVFIIIAVTVLLFTIMQMMPGDPIQLISSPRVSPERVAQLEKQWGLDKPPYVQYFYWFYNVLKGDLGNSITTGEKVSKLVE